MKLKKVLFLFLTFWIANSVTAQDSSFLSKAQFGSNLRFIIQKEQVPTLCFTYNVQKNHFVRAQIGYNSSSGSQEKDINSTNTLNNGTGVDTTIKNSPFDKQDFLVKLGYYRTSLQTGKFNVYYGLDFLYRNIKDNSELHLETEREFSPSQIQFFNTSEKIKRRTTSYGLAPLFGIQYSINKRFKLGYEMQFEVFVENFEKNSNSSITQSSSFDPRIFTTTLAGTENRSSFNTQLQMLSGIFLTYNL